MRRKLFEGGGEDHTRLFWQTMSQLHSIEIRHLDVEEQQVWLLRLDGIDGCDGVCE